MFYENETGRDAFISLLESCFEMGGGRGYDDYEENIRTTARFTAEKLDNRVKQLLLMPYRHLGTERYTALCMDCQMECYNASARNDWETDIRHLVKIMQSYSVPALAGASVKYDG